MKNTTLLVDTNIAIDLFDNKEPFRTNAEKIFALCSMLVEDSA